MGQLQMIFDTLVTGARFSDNTGLLNGKTGIALFLFHLARATGNSEYEAYAGEMIDQIMESLHETGTADYADGLAGFGVGISYMIRQRFIGGDADEVLADIDRVIRQQTPFFLNSKPETGTGKTGLGKYFTERLANRTVLPENDPNRTALSSIIRSLSCPYETYREILGVIHILSEAIPLGVEPEKTRTYLNCAVDQMETMVHEDRYFGSCYPGQFNPLVAAAVLCRASTKTGNSVFADRALRYIRLYEPVFRANLCSESKVNALKWSFLYGYLGCQFQNSELLHLSEKWLACSREKEFEPNTSLGLLDGYAGAGMYLLSTDGLCSDEWLDIVPCYVEKMAYRMITVL